MKVRNFRLLKDFELDIKDELSLIIGKNNCGKTSVFLILDKMLNSSKLLWEDIHLEWQEKLYEQIIGFSATEPMKNNGLEAIKLQLFIEYNDNDSYENIHKFMMDLDPDNNIIVLEFVLLISDKKIIELKDTIVQKHIEKFKVFSKFISKNFLRFFEVKKYSRGCDIKSGQLREDRSNEFDDKNIAKIIKIVGIRADRAVSNDDRNHVLSNLTGQYFNSYKAAQNESEPVFIKLEEAVEDADKALYNIYNGELDENGQKNEGIFSDVISTIKIYGGVENGIDIAIESSISEKNLLSDNTNLSYRQGENGSLPETYNGLGYLNLIGILFEIETKIQELLEKPGDINVLYIEEPEAHTHPQLQYIFIRNIRAHIRKHREELLEKNKQFQVLITTHSSHIVSECDFNDIVYMKKIDNQVFAKNFNSLSDEYGGDQLKEFKFVKNYLTLNRSELFFADKAICIEGNTERILMPNMMKKVDEKKSTSKGMLPLLSQNISIIEVGAHSHIFIPLFKFLGIKVLIITDIDASIKENGRYKKCNPEQAKYTSNASIRNFFNEVFSDESENQFRELVGKETQDKIKNNIRIAYQIPESGCTYQASSFEDAFIFLNKNFILSNKEGFYQYGALEHFENEELEQDLYQFSLDVVKKKSAFASSILFFDGENGTEWKVPRYIEEGLLWIREN